MCLLLQLCFESQHLAEHLCLISIFLRYLHLFFTALAWGCQSVGLSYSFCLSSIATKHLTVSMSINAVLDFCPPYCLLLCPTPAISPFQCFITTSPITQLLKPTLESPHSTSLIPPPPKHTPDTRTLSEPHPSTPLLAWITAGASSLLSLPTFCAPHSPSLTQQLK